MALCSTIGIDELELTMRELADLPDDTRADICEAGAIVAEAAITQSAKTVAPVDTGQLWQSIKRIKKYDEKKGGSYYIVYPHGKRDPKPPKGQRRKSGELKATTNAEVGFILEFGAPRRHIPAYQWMGLAVEKCADAVAAAMRDKYDEYLKSKGI